SDVRDALEAARERPQADPSVAPVAVGLSFGGHVAVLAASRLKLRACVALYAGWLAGTSIGPSRPQPTGSLPLTGPLLVLVGESAAYPQKRIFRQLSKCRSKGCLRREWSALPGGARVHSRSFGAKGRKVVSARCASERRARACGRGPGSA